MGKGNNYYFFMYNIDLCDHILYYYYRIANILFIWHFLGEYLHYEIDIIIIMLNNKLRFFFRGRVKYIRMNRITYEYLLATRMNEYIYKLF